jgi:hypothetical protein
MVVEFHNFVVVANFSVKEDGSLALTFAVAWLQQQQQCSAVVHE